MEKSNETKNVIVETYAEDMARVIEGGEEGLVKKIIHGEEESEAEKKNLSPESKKNKMFMLLSILLILLAVLLLSFFFLKKTDNTVPAEEQFTPIVFNDQTTFLEVSGFKKEEITQTVESEVVDSKVKPGGLEGIYLTENKKVIGLRRFISLTESSFVPGDSTLLVSDNFLMGTVRTLTDSPTEAGKGFFILLKVRSTADIFDSMHAWEKTMFADLHGFLGMNIGADTNYLLSEVFEDTIIENKNARVLSDKAGQPILMYIFADDNSVIITDSQNSAHEVMLRLASSRAKQ